MCIYSNYYLPYLCDLTVILDLFKCLSRWTIRLKVTECSQFVSKFVVKN